MTLFSVSRSNVTPTVNLPLLIFEANTGQMSRIVEVSLQTLGNASGVNEYVLARVSGGSGFSGGPTPFALEPEARSAGGQTYIPPLTVPPTEGNTILRIPINSDTGFFLWQAPAWGSDEQDEGILIRSQNRIAIIPKVVDGTTPMSVCIIMDSY